MPTILGAHSPKLDAVRALRTAAGRRAQGRFAVDGATMLGEALAAGCEPEAIYASDAGVEALRASDVAGRDVLRRTFVVNERAMAKLSDLETPPGILAVFPTRHVALAEPFARGEAAVALARLADPGNAGTLVRTAEIFGIGGAVFGTGGVDPYHPKVVRATMGAIFRVRIARADGDELARAARTSGYELVATDGAGEALPGFRFAPRSVLIVGNERRGIDGFSDVDRTVSIPQDGAGESLNAAIAGGIVMYAFAQQRRADPSKKPDLSRLGDR